MEEKEYPILTGVELQKWLDQKPTPPPTEERILNISSLICTLQTHNQQMWNEFVAVRMNERQTRDGKTDVDILCLELLSIIHTSTQILCLLSGVNKNILSKG